MMSDFQQLPPVGQSPCSPKPKSYESPNARLGFMVSRWHLSSGADAWAIQEDGQTIQPTKLKLIAGESDILAQIQHFEAEYIFMNL